MKNFTDKKVLSMMLVIAMVMTMSAFMGMTVTASSAPADVSASIGYETETLNFTVTPAPAAAGFAVLYSLKAIPDAAITKTYKYDSEKWYPVYIDATGTGSIDISKYIPKFKIPKTATETPPVFTIAYRLANDVATTITLGTTPNDYKVTIYSTRAIIDIPARPSEKAYKIGTTPVNANDLKSLVAYNNGNDYTVPETPVLSANGSLKNSSATLDVSVKVGLNAGWTTVPAGKSMDISGSSFPTGDTAAVKWAATSTSFASAPINVKIPATPKAPVLNGVVAITPNSDNTILTKATLYKGFTAKMQYSADGTVWSDLTAENVTALNKGSSSTDIVKALAISGTPTSIMFRVSGTTYKTDSKTKTISYDNSKPNSAVTAIPVTDTAAGTVYATVGNVSVAGVRNTDLSAVDATITLAGDTFKSAINAGTDLKSWFNLPTGLTAKVKTAVSAGDSAVTVTIAGKPTSATAGEIPMVIKIPATALTNGKLVQVTANAKAVYAITAPPSTTPNLDALKAAVKTAQDLLASVKVSALGNGSEATIATGNKWAAKADYDAYNAAITTAAGVTTESAAAAAKAALDTATTKFDSAVKTK